MFSGSPGQRSGQAVCCVPRRFILRTCKNLVLAPRRPSVTRSPGKSREEKRHGSVPGATIRATAISASSFSKAAFPKPDAGPGGLQSQQFRSTINTGEPDCPAAAGPGMPCSLEVRSRYSRSEGVSRLAAKRFASGSLHAEPLIRRRPPGKDASSARRIGHRRVEDVHLGWRSLLFGRAKKRAGRQCRPAQSR